MRFGANTNEATDTDACVKQLPEGWAEVALEDIGSLHCGQSPSTTAVNTEGRGMPYVSGPDQWDGKTLHVHKWTTNPKRVVPECCVFITVKGAGVGTIFPGVPSAIGRDVYAFQPARELSAEFVMRALEITISEIKRQAAGDIPGLSRDHILKHVIGLPPRDEQYRIISTLTDSATRVQSAREHLAKVPKILKAFRQSVVAAACSGRLTADWRAGKEIPQSSEPRDRPESLAELPDLPSSWSWRSQGELSNVVDPQPSHRTPPIVSHGIPYVGMGDIDEYGNIGFEAARKISPRVLAEHRSRYELRQGDFIFGKIGTLGKPILLPEPFDYTLSANVVLIQPNRDVVRSEYLFMYMQGAFVNSLLLSESRASAQPAFGIKRIRELPVPLAPASEQDEIVRRVGILFRLSEKIEKRVEAATKRADEITQSILAKAFRGELVPSEAELARREGRKYEPASILLERIKDERGKVTLSSNGADRRTAKLAKK